MVSQPKPESEKSPYFDLASSFKVKIDFRPFIHVEGVEGKDFRKKRINILDHKAVIFTSRNAVDHFFRICEELRLNVPDSMKYFCVSESTAYYLQKYVVYRKRKIFHGRQSIKDLLDVIKKHSGENFLLPCSDIHKQDVPALLEENGISFTKAILYNTVCSDLSDLKDVNYDVLVFFSPSGIKSLFKNFPEFEQNSTKIAVFGSTTAKAAEDAKLRIDISAPLPEAPSMSLALENHIKQSNKR